MCHSACKSPIDVRQLHQATRSDVLVEAGSRNISAFSGTIRWMSLCYPLRLTHLREVYSCPFETKTGGKGSHSFFALLKSDFKVLKVIEYRNSFTGAMLCCQSVLADPRIIYRDRLFSGIEMIDPLPCLFFSYGLNRNTESAWSDMPTMISKGGGCIDFRSQAFWLCP